MNDQYKPESSKPELSDQMLTVHKQLPLIILLNLPLIAVIAWIYWPWVDQFWLVFWAAGMLLLMVIRIVLVVFYGDRLVARFSASSQQRILILNSLISGVMWGVAGYLLFVPDKLDYQLILLIILVIKGTGSVSSIVNSLPAFYAYFPLSMLPISVMFLLQEDLTSVLLGIISLFFTVIVVLFGRNLNRTLLESLRIRYENARLLEQAEHRKQQAENADRAKTRFLAAASHDLRQPIHALSLFIDVLERRQLDTESKSIIQQMQRSVASLQHLLEALLDISRLDTGAVQASAETFDVREITERLQMEFQMLADEKGLQLAWPKKPVYVHSDPMLLEQVLRNLVANAIRYTPAGQVRVSCLPVNDHVRIEVQDSGIGIETSQQQAIFKEFYQVGNQQRDSRHGLGLGLAIVARIMVLLDSRIELVSSPHIGACFAFELTAGLETDIAVDQKRPAPYVFLQQETDCCVAIIEDDKAICDAMQLLLESWGYRTLIAFDGDDLLKKLRANGDVPDVIISDLQLGQGRNGVKEVERVRQTLAKTVPALIITGNIGAEYKTQIQAAGLPWLYKPVAPAKLRALLRSQSAKAAK
jgi:signal transduction histidine kinase/CheY-like chemotaxis protein